MGLAAVGVEFVFGHDQDAVVVRAAFVGNRDAGGAFRDRAVADELHGANTDPVVTETGAHAGSDHGIDVGIADKAVGTIEKFAGIAGVLIGDKVGGIAVGLVSGGDARFGEHFGDELHAFAVIVTGELIGNGFFDQLVGAFGGATGEFAGGGIVIDFSAGWVRSLVGDAGFLERQRIAIARVAAAMFDRDRMIGKGGVEIGEVKRAAIGGFGVVVFEAENPVAWGCFGGAFAESGLNGRNRAEIAIDHAQMHQAGLGGMGVGINESREDGFAAEIDFLRGR